MPQARKLIDTQRRIPTPEGFELELSLAGPIVRALAWLLDLLIRGGILLALASVLGLLGAFGQAAALLSWFLIEWFYPVFFEVLRDGSTPGKRTFGMMVIQDDGTPVTWQASIIRNLLRVADFLPALYGFGLICMLMSDEFKRIGDYAARTLVVYRHGEIQHGGIADAAPLAPSMPLTLAEQRAVIGFAERQSLLTPARSVELAQLVSPLLGGNAADAAPQRMLRIANFLIGRR